MRKIEILAILLLVLWAISFIPHFGMNILVGKLYGPQGHMQLNAMQNSFILVQTVLMAAVKLGIGIWLFIEARKHNKCAWIWMLLGLVFGIPAAILYYLMMILERLNQVTDEVHS